MWSKRCGSGGGRLCPLSFGVALGVTSGLAFLLWSIWLMYYGLPPQLVASGVVITWGDAITHSLAALVKGFIFGFVVALLYDLITCACRCKCCKRDNNAACGCGCKCCSPDKNEGPKVV